ncbi:MAG: glutamyl-tRNA reductase [Dehalococcoidia bacterium]|nr:glutamyl-tRNA reductase [Dehalococcoidia bacterium]
MITQAGLSHRTAPIEVRERLTVADDAVVPLLRAARETFGRGAALLSTCNRLELYVGDEVPEDALHAFIAETLDAEVSTVARHFQTKRGLDAVRHLYGVASGVDSMVLGETEVLGQVRAAFSSTVKAGTDDAVISRLFHTALRTGRRARRETAISERALSVSSIAAQQARLAFPDLSRASVLVVGAGEAGRLAAQAIVASGAQDVVVTNRTASRAEGLAAELGGRAAPFEELPDALARAHIVISAVGAPTPVVPAALLQGAMQRRDGEALLAIDIGVPRDFESGVRSLHGVTYFDLDDLREVADRNAEARRAEVEAVEGIVEEETHKFSLWADTQRVQPTITELAARAEALRLDVIERTLRSNGVTAAEREHLETLADQVTRHLVKRLLAAPIEVLRERGDRSFTLEATRALFRLDNPNAPDADELTGDIPLDD